MTNVTDYLAAKVITETYLEDQTSLELPTLTICHFNDVDAKFNVINCSINSFENHCEHEYTGVYDIIGNEQKCLQINGKF